MNAKSLLKSMPPLREQEETALNGLFTAYIFRNAAGDIWTSCCGTHKNLLQEGALTSAELDLLAARHTPEPKMRYYTCLNELESKRRVRCPYCGAEAKMKELKYCGGRKNLWEYRRGVVLRQWRGALWALAYDLYKDYRCSSPVLLREVLTAPPDKNLLGIYRFTPGKAECATKHWWSSGNPESYKAQTAPGKSGKMWDIHAPYGYCSEYGTSYEVVGLEELAKSKIKYCGAVELAQSCKPIELLTACCFYPSQIEWLHRIGLDEVIKDLVNRDVKNARAVRWEAKRPRDFLGISPQELRIMQDYCKSITMLPTLKLYRKLSEPRDRKQIPACAEIAGLFSDLRRSEMLWKRTVGRGMKPSAVVAYLKREEATGQIYLDYLDAAEKIGLDLSNPIYLTPKELHRKHDSATNAWAAMQDKEKLKAYYPRLKKLAQRYTYCDGTYFIRPPVSGEEIKREGQLLHHCVGGYADRHLNGATTILFLRDVKRPLKPLVTIEMSGNNIQQIYGWDDERTACPENPNRIPAKILYASILKPWLAWLKAGSKRDKRGLPRKTRQKEKKTA